MIDGYVAGYDAWNECHPDNPEYKNKKDMNKRKWKDYMEAHLSGQWAWPVPPFDITTIHGVTFNVRKINPTGTLEGLLPDGRTQIATFEYVDINSIVLPHQPAPNKEEGDLFGLNEDEVKTLLEYSLKPEEIAGDPAVQHDRIKELLKWFLRLSQRGANPKWTTSHAFELAYYIATNAGNRHIDLDAVKKAAWLEGAQITPAERSLAEKIGMLPKHSLPVDIGGKVLEWDSYHLIGRVRERFKELEAKGWDWRSFYSGWLEGRADMYGEIKGIKQPSQPPSEAGMSQQDVESLEMLILLENHGNKMEIHCPDEDDEMTVTVIDEDAGEPANYSLTLDEAETLALYLVRHVNNSRNAALPFGKWLDKYCDPHKSTTTRQGEVPEEIPQWVFDFIRDTHAPVKDFYSGAIAMYHKMQEEIAIYKNMWMIADKTMNELRLKVQELNKITNG